MLKLVRADGSAIPLDRYALHDTRLDIEAPPGLGTGTAVLSWRVISEDGHPVGGSVVFSIGAPSRSPAACHGRHGRRAGPCGDLDRRAWRSMLASSSASAGPSSSPGYRRCRAAVSAFRELLLLGLVAVPLSVGLQGLDALDLPLAGLDATAVWRAGLATSYGITAAVALPALLLGLLSVGVRRAGRGEGAGAGGAAGRGHRALPRAAMRARQPRNG